jgi:FkbM family methyltransferase
MKERIYVSLLSLCLILFGLNLGWNSFSCFSSWQDLSKKFHAQYQEDYILDMLFANQDKGFYVDVGANHPTFSNPAKYFYDKGWSGVNIEPIKYLFDLLVKDRPRDKNYNLGVSNKEGVLELFQTDVHGLSSFKDVSSKFKISEKYKVNVRTLTEILDEVQPKEIDFLKVDVEGYEKNVLLGMDFKKYRPKVILLEAMDAMNGEYSHQDWEYILFNAKYEFIHFDGLNRYYIDSNDKEVRMSLLAKMKRVKQCSTVVRPRFTK